MTLPFDKSRIAAAIRKHGPMKLHQLLPHFPELTRKQLQWMVQTTPGIESKNGVWDVIRHIASSRYIPPFVELKYDLHANARLREGALDYQQMPSRFV